MTTLKDVHLVAQSGNRKTGPLPVTYRPVNTCPTDCAFLPTGATGGCYGSGRLFAMAGRHSTTLDVEEGTRMVRDGRDPRARYLRDRVVGDVVTEAGKLDRPYIRGIASIALANDLVPFGYSHAWRRFTPADVKFLGAAGYVMNASTETHSGAAEATARGLPVVLVDNEAPDGTVIAGRRLVTCPAETRAFTSCASCGLCASADRPIIVRFHTHGVARAKARAAVELARRKEAC